MSEPLYTFVVQARVNYLVSVGVCAYRVVLARARTVSCRPSSMLCRVGVLVCDRIAMRFDLFISVDLPSSSVSQHFVPSNVAIVARRPLSIWELFSPAHAILRGHDARSRSLTRTIATTYVDLLLHLHLPFPFATHAHAHVYACLHVAGRSRARPLTTTRSPQHLPLSTLSMRSELGRSQPQPSPVLRPFVACLPCFLCAKLQFTSPCCQGAVWALLPSAVRRTHCFLSLAPTR
jgi:hypothetical protein